MFKKSLHDRLSNIFTLKRVSFDAPSDAKEQEILFVNIFSASSRVSNGRAISKVVGEITIFAQNDKLPFGFFQKKINQADNSDVSDFFFYNFDQNEKYYGNLVERKVNFVYFYNEQYNPARGTINELQLSEV